jgi:hypothetical protein
MNTQQSLSVYFMWHPDEDELNIQSHIDYCFKMLKRDSESPFSRALNIPVFLITSHSAQPPQPVNFMAKKNVVFVFICENLLLDDDWTEYVEHFQTVENCVVVPIALELDALNFDGGVEGRNFIRAYEYDKAFYRQNLLISITHEIYRLALNKDYDPASSCKRSAITFFLSHAKDGKQGVVLAQALKDFIENTPMNKFFDTTDISPGFRFDDVIAAEIEKSTVIAIHSDPYSSRYWCQKEIHCAKENNRPMIAVDCLTEYEDRRFPYASNIPGVRLYLEETQNNGDDIQCQVEPKHLYRVIMNALLETVRFFYAQQFLQQYKDNGCFEDDALILSRPPELIDALKGKAFSNTNVGSNTFIYPEPPLYSDELETFKELGMTAVTPLNAHNVTFLGKTIGISISDPADNELIDIGQSEEHLKQLSQDVARHLLARESTLVYGGDLRPDGFTTFMLDEAQALQARLSSTKVHLKNYLAWPIFTNKDTKEMKKRYRKIAKMVEISPADEVNDQIPDIKSFLKPDSLEHRYIWSRCLSKMRNQMITDCDIRICAGGKHAEYKGAMPGVLEEVLIAIAQKKPIYLLGGFGGVSKSLCELIKTSKVPEKLTKQWQIDNNNEYIELYDMLQTNAPDYDNLANVISLESLNNGLTPEENESLFNTPYADDAIRLIFKGLGC